MHTVSPEQQQYICVITKDSRDRSRKLRNESVSKIHTHSYFKKSGLKM